MDYSMSMMKTCINLMMVLWLLSFTSCGKKFLDVKADQRQRIPVSISDYQALLDNTETMNGNSAHALGIIGGDEYYLTDGQYDAFPTSEAFRYQLNAYTWEPVIYEGGEGRDSRVIDWAGAYMRINWCNQVSDGLEKITPKPEDSESYFTAAGTAYFHRAFNYYSLAQLYCPPYDAETANKDMGLPLRLEADLIVKVARSSLKETYDRIIEDLKKSSDRLPPIAINAYRPSKAAAYTMLARVYLQLQQYDQALSFAEKALLLQGALIDFSDLEITANYTFPVWGSDNAEVIFMNGLGNFNLIILGDKYSSVDTNLLSLYPADDLRLPAYFMQGAKETVIFKGSYTGDENYFTGLAADELYLIRAECRARLSDVNGALDDLNFLRKHRFLSTNYQPLESADQEQVLTWVLEERRRELVFRGVRWEDLRRLNRQQKYAVSLTRIIGDDVFELPPNDKRYTWPLPIEAIELDGLEQNDR
ncbi:MAG: RagB/SusD family nutrient uptake outer membrane protein [Parapedobacter sp.]|nr:MAG: RagB/SusD family nutrient uptake outer membrane protein [Parapedobacter sp.]